MIAVRHDTASHREMGDNVYRGSTGRTTGPLVFQTPGATGKATAQFANHHKRNMDFDRPTKNTPNRRNAFAEVLIPFRVVLSGRAMRSPLGRSMVEVRGFEPLAFALRTRRSTN